MLLNGLLLEGAPAANLGRSGAPDLGGSGAADAEVRAVSEGISRNLALEIKRLRPILRELSEAAAAGGNSTGWYAALLDPNMAGTMAGTHPSILIWQARGPARS